MVASFNIQNHIIRVDPRWPFFSVDLELTNSCDNACIFCPQEKMTRPIGFMDEQVFQTIARHLIQIPSRIAFSGMGNPLLHPKLSHFIKLYKSIGGTIGVVVHAGNLTKDAQNRLWEAEPSFIEISLPTIQPEVFKTLCPGFSLDTCLEQIKEFSDQAARNIRISVIGLETGLNRDEADSFHEFWKNRHLSARVFPCHSRGHNLQAPNLTCAPVSHSHSCGLFAMHAFITWQGRLLACCHDLSGETDLGNVVAEDLSLLGNRKADILEKGLPFSFCQTCDEPRKGLPIPDRSFPESEKARSRFLRSYGRALKRSFPK